MNKMIKRIISIVLMTSLLLTATALVMPPSNGLAAATPITATCSSSDQSGTPGTTLHYSVVIANGDTVNDASITLTASAARGVITAPVVIPDTSTTPLTIGSSSSATVIVDVPIPSTATAGQNDIITLVINETGAFATSVSLTVNVVAAGAGANRPQLTVNSYSTSISPVKAYSEFELSMTVVNSGQVPSYNNTFTFSGDGFLPTSNGGMQTEKTFSAGGKITITQKFKADASLAWLDTGTITVTANYTDSAGTAYSNTFSLTIPLVTPYTGPAATATPKTTLRPQLIITGNSTDIDPLQSGSIFELTLNVQNMGNLDAKSVIMVLGGGSVATNDTGTPQPGGVNGSSAELTNFAPLGSSNIIVVGNIAQGASVTLKQKFVVNVTTAPGAYTLKTSFTYIDSNGKSYVDDQVVTLLVYSLPKVEISFYSNPGTLTAGMPISLPLQVTNLGKSSAVLGNMKVTSPNADITNNVSLVGALESGGYYTFDPEVIPMTEGPLEIDVIINYTDDFNQTRTITQTLTLDVMAVPTLSPEEQSALETPVEPVVETFWSKLGRFFKGLLGLDSGITTEPVDQSGIEEIPVEDFSPAVPKG